MNSFKEAGGTVVKWLATAIGGPKRLYAFIAAATLSTADMLLTLIGIYVEDITHLKKAFLKQIDADTKKKVSEAVEASNRATRARRNAAIVGAEALAEVRIKEATANELDARAIATVESIASRRMEARAMLIQSLINLKKEGGEFLIDREVFKNLIESGHSQGESNTPATQ